MYKSLFSIKCRISDWSECINKLQSAIEVSEVAMETSME